VSRLRAAELLRRAVPAPVKAMAPVRLKAWARAALGIEPWPDLAIRHPMFRTREFRALRRDAAAFDVFRKAYKPPIERGHQTSYLVARWFAAAGVRTVFHVGYSNGRYLFYFDRLGIRGGGVELVLEEAPTTPVPAGVFDVATEGRLLRGDFFELRRDDVAKGWDAVPLDVLFTEATFETLFPWRRRGFSVAKYGDAEAAVRRRLLEERLPATLRDLAPAFRNVVLIEPEPDAGGARAVFEGCARALPGFAFSTWRFRPPFDRLFQLSPSEPTRQAVYAYVRDAALLDGLRAYAEQA
jgi:hypothetical protein